GRAGTRPGARLGDAGARAPADLDLGQRAGDDLVAGDLLDDAERLDHRHAALEERPESAGDLRDLELPQHVAKDDDAELPLVEGEAARGRPDVPWDDEWDQRHDPEPEPPVASLRVRNSQRDALRERQRLPQIAAERVALR